MSGAAGSSENGAGTRRVGRPPTLDRVAVLDAAGAMIARRGFDSTRYADVAAAAGVPVSTIQNAFGSRHNLLVSALEHASEADLQKLDAVPRASSQGAWHRLAALLEVSIGGPEHRDSWLLWLEFWRVVARDPALADRARRIHERWYATLASIIGDGLATGEFDTSLSPPDAAAGVLAVIDGSAIALVLRAVDPNPAEALRLALATVRTMVGVTDRPGA